KSGNKFIFEIDFLKHSNTIEYLFNVPEGGPGFQYWYNYFSDKKDFPMSDKEKLLYPNYIEYFYNQTSAHPKKPTIFLFDNEPSGNPLYAFVNYAKDLEISSSNLNQIRGSSFSKIAKKNSLYIMATPLIKNWNQGTSSDIEDLIVS
ncbi:TPA: RNA-directed DNA polymerase, partial [Streptococcus suis]|nr:RNA-directed DNA polymerase [Streptococcus suis]